jgi:hypothetical protein
MNKSHLTAITRRALSLPTRYLKQAGLLVGLMLDYGCGRGFDCDELGCDGYDPYWRDSFTDSIYDTIFCNYVLNVLPDEDQRNDTLGHIQRLLVDGGKAYITVRNDKFVDGHTSKATWQGHVRLELPIVKICSGFVMYCLDKDAVLRSK